MTEPPRADSRGAPDRGGADGRADAADPPGLGDLLAEAEALHAALADARGRAARLVAGLRRQRRRSRLMESTLAALDQLKLAGAAR